MGRADILLTAGLKLNRPDLKEKALFKAGQIVTLAKETGGFRCGIEDFLTQDFSMVIPESVMSFSECLILILFRQYYYSNDLYENRNA
jgi:hypothetical protein